MKALFIGKSTIVIVNNDIEIVEKQIGPFFTKVTQEYTKATKRLLEKYQVSSFDKHYPDSIQEGIEFLQACKNLNILPPKPNGS